MYVFQAAVLACLLQVVVQCCRAVQDATPVSRLGKKGISPHMVLVFDCRCWWCPCCCWQGHAEELVRDLSLEQLQELDGIVAVGGDGLFAELLTAVLQHKHLTAALQLRLGHIPAGSTDAVACT